MLAPIIDITNIDDASASTAIAQQICEASRLFGFFTLKNHTIPLSSIDGMFQLARRYFVDVSEGAKAQWPVRSCPILMAPPTRSSDIERITTDQ